MQLGKPIPEGGMFGTVWPIRHKELWRCSDSNKRTGIIIIKTEIINEQGIRVMSTICYNMRKVESQSIGETPDPLLRCMHRGRYTGYSIWLLSVIWRKRRSWRPRQAHHPTVSVSTVAGLDVQASARRYARRVIGLGGFGRLR